MKGEVASAPIKIRPNKALLVLIFGICLLATAMESIDLNALAVVIPGLMKQFGTSFDKVIWVSTSYAITTSLSSLLVGRLILIFGSKRLFIVATIGFSIASFLCGLSSAWIISCFSGCGGGIWGSNGAAFRVLYSKVFFKKAALDVIGDMGHSCLDGNGVKSIISKCYR